MKTAKEARLLSNSFSSKKKFLDTIEKTIDLAIAEQKTACVVLYYDDTIGNVYDLFDNKVNNPFDCLTIIGRECVEELQKLGYKIELSLFYEERQLVDIRLKFLISW